MSESIAGAEHERDAKQTIERDLAGPLEPLEATEADPRTATNYFIENALPNIFFHLTTAYAILRHNGVDVGKRDYLGAMTFR